MIKVKTPPTLEIITLAEMKVYLKIESDQTEEDTLIQSQIDGVIAEIEDMYNVCLGEQVIEEYYDRYDHYYPLTKGPVSTVDDVHYLKDGVWTALTADDDYVYDAVSHIGRLQIINAFEADDQVNAVRITYTSGVDDKANLPRWIYQPIRMLVRAYHEPIEYAEKYRATAAYLLRHIKQRYSRE